MKTYIQSNVLKGPFYNLNKILRDKVHQKWINVRLNHFITTNNNVIGAIDSFADYLTVQLFGFKAAKLILNEHKEIIKDSAITNGDINEFRTLFKQIIKRNFTYNPKTGDNNLNSLSSLLIKDLNIWLNNTIAKKATWHEINNLFVRDALYFTIRAVMVGIALRWIAYGRYIGKKSLGIYKNFSKSGKQYKMLVSEKIIGSILFRGMHFEGPLVYHKNIGYAIPIKLKLEQHLKNVLYGLDYGFNKKGTSWSRCRNVAAKFGPVPDTFKNETFNDYLKKLKYSKTGVFCSVNCDRVSDIKKIVKHGLKNADNIDMRISLMLSYPLINNYSKNLVKEPVQLALNVGDAGYSEEKEVIFLPNKLVLSDNGVDGRILFRKLI